MAFPRNLIFDSVLRRAAIETDTRNSEHPKLNLEVVMEGKVAYKSVPPAIHVHSLGSDISLASDSSTRTYAAKAIVQ